MSYRQIVQHTLALCATAHITRLKQGKINERINLNRKGYFTSRMMKRLCSYEWTFSCITLVNSGTKRSYHILITIVFLLIFDPFSRPLQQYNASEKLWGWLMLHVVVTIEQHILAGAVKIIQPHFRRNILIINSSFLCL